MLADLAVPIRSSLDFSSCSQRREGVSERGFLVLSPRCRDSVVAAKPPSLGVSLPLIELPITASLSNLQLELRS
jgi:hypothetical protein